MEIEGSEILKNNLDKKIINKEYKAVSPFSFIFSKLISENIKINKEYIYINIINNMYTEILLKREY